MYCAEGDTVLCQLCSIQVSIPFFIFVLILTHSLFRQFLNIQVDIAESRAGASLGQKRSADRMLAASNKKYKRIEVGCTVILEVPKVDRGPLDCKNLIGIILNQ